MEGVVRYKVTISAIVKRTKKIGQDWAVVSQKVDDSGKTIIPLNVHGYTPEIVKEVEEDLILFEQRVDTLDMKEVVAVLNGISIDRTKS